MTELVEAATREIEELHVAFEQWFGGESENLDRVEAALTHDFTMVTPNGETVERADLIEGLKEAQGAVELKIEIKNTTVRWEGADGMLVTYEEWQTTPTNSNARQSTVLFEHDWGAPNGLRWVHVHETWMPTPAE